MRAVETLMMVLAVSVLGIGIWAVHKWVPQSALSIFRPAATQASQPVAPPAPKPAQAAKKRAKPAPMRDIALPLGAINVDVTPSLPFPSPIDLPAGTTRAQVIAKYGQPIARVSGVEDGRLIERFYFLRPDRTRITIALLRSGIVASADSVLNEHATTSQP